MKHKLVTCKRDLGPYSYRGGISDGVATLTQTGRTYTHMFSIPIEFIDTAIADLEAMRDQAAGIDNEIKRAG